MNDIIDNRNQKLVDQINCILDSSAAAHFAVGYFFLSGFTAIAERLTNIKELRLLIGNTSNRETVEQIAQGYRRLELIADKVEAQKYPKRSEEKRMANDTAANIRSSIELMDQTDEAETLVKNLVQMIEEKRLHVRVYTKGTLHAKAYIFDYGTIYDGKGRVLERAEKGIAIVGSSDYNQAEEQDLIDVLRQVSGKYDLADFNGQRLQQHIEHDINILKKIQALVEPIAPDKDAKLQTLINWLDKPILKDKKRLIFTQYADTAKYLYENLNPQGKQDDIDVIYNWCKFTDNIICTNG
ncbi:phospholipase D-like domain-containing protein [Nostoc sp.]